MMLALFKHIGLSLRSIEDIARISDSGDSKKYRRWMRVDLPKRGLFEKSNDITRVFDLVKTRKRSIEIVSSDKLFFANDTFKRIKGSLVDKAFPKWWSY
jgi:hypothetical protein